jgi:nucleotide-binding universal stress UspA family protein
VETIVVGYDGTRHSERALRRAAELARPFGARVVVVTVVAPAPLEPAATVGGFGLLPYWTYPLEEPGESAKPEEALWQRHRERVEGLFAEAGVPAEFAGVLGEPVERIIDVAEETHADLIVVGTREPGFFERLFGGSVSTAVARQAHCDVLVVHPGTDEGGAP